MSLEGTTDFVVVGSGVAGLATALKASRHGQVTIVTKGRIMDSNTRYAQGGIAAALGPGDTPKDHLNDTLAAGHGLCVPEAATVLVEDGPVRVRELIDWGARFDSAPDGTLELGREAAHSRNRILHARGDATGAEVAEVLAQQVLATDAVTVEEHLFAVDLVVRDGRCVGITAVDSRGEPRFIRAKAVVLATGGCGRIFRYTTNPAVATGDGFAMAARQNVPLIDMEFVQFHPTALAFEGDDPLVLVSEAVRGEGALLVNDRGERFMTAVHPQAELAPRDVVARAIFREMAKGRTVYLDASPVGERFPDRFPTIHEACLERGVDPRSTPIPVTPAAHFIMGGIRTDTEGRTGLPGLFAVGEVACTGVHGANRLASNSLLEGLVFAERIARALRDERKGPLPADDSPDLDGRLEAAQEFRRDEADEATRALTIRLRQTMWDHAGIVRRAEGLAAALRTLDAIEAEAPKGAGTLRNMIATSRLIVRAALEREESRGGHYREDFPTDDPRWRGRHVVL